MDKLKIWQFIANYRKDIKLTQEQLAEKLNISKNAVSKWERGICLMDMSLLKPLSEILSLLFLYYQQYKFQFLNYFIRKYRVIFIFMIL